MESYRTELFFIALAAALAPLLSRLPQRLRMPVVVMEILLGMAIGPQILNLASDAGLISMLGELGLCFLLFMVGIEIDLEQFRGKLLTLALGGWVLSFVIAMAGTLFFYAIGLIHVPPVLAAVAVSTTALGIVAPILRDSTNIDADFGALLLSAAAMGEFGPLLIISFALIPTHSTVWHTLFMLAFVGISFLVVDMAIRVRSSPWMNLIAETMRSSGQLPARICIAVQALLVALASKFGINVVIGAFAAGLVVNLCTEGEASADLRHSLNAIGYGFLIPFFFISAGMRFDIGALWSTPLVPVQIVILLLLLVLVRGAPIVLYGKLLTAEQRLPFALYSATGLPLIVIVSEIGVSSGLMSPDKGAVLVSAGMISVVLFPALAQKFIAEAKVAANQ
ncbi:cation:proton antiporter [Methylomonas sp. MgM2]